MRRLLAVFVLAVLVFAAWKFAFRGGSDALVVYCAHDAVFADSILKDFEAKAGIRVAPKYDTEAAKSLGLVERLLAEREHPVCDVFWNNEAMGTMDLAEKGILEPYKGPGWARMPERYRDEDGRWAGFAGRLRVLIWNTERLSSGRDPFGGIRLPADAPHDDGRDCSRIAIAKPLYGTTLTHYAVLWNLWGADRVKAWHGRCRAQGIREVRGNAAVKDEVASGVCDQGYTDTDDYFEAKDAGKPVRMKPAGTLLPAGSRLEAAVPGSSDATICIPNTVGIVKGARRLESAKRLADFLLSAETELALARSRSRQIPLGPVDERSLPEEVRPLAEAAKKGVPLKGLLKARNECLEWLKANP